MVSHQLVNRKNTYYKLNRRFWYRPKRSWAIHGDNKGDITLKDNYKRYRAYSKERFIVKIYKFFKYLFKDIAYYKKHGKPFSEFGVTLYSGRQGAGKTIALVEYLERMRSEHPDAYIITNFGYINQTHEFNDWNDFFNIRNGEKGCIFALDELQNEFSSTEWKNFPPELLSEITQQRKQKIKIVGTSQVFTRVAKQIREQTFDVVECYTLAGRWTFLKAFDALEYESVIQNPVLKNKLKRTWRRNFVQDDEIRDLYDSYAKVEKLTRTEFLPKKDRIE